MQETKVDKKEELKPKMFIPRVRSRHNSHHCLRGNLLPLPFPSVVRLGSTTLLKDKYSVEGTRIQCNSVRAIENSSDKLLMKRCFDSEGILTPGWIEIKNPDYIVSELGVKFNEGKHSMLFPFVCKRRKSSRNRGNTLIKNQEEFVSWARNRCLFDYIIETYVPYLKEYRIHVTAEKAFYSCRKALKSDTPKDKRWYRNDSNSVWLTEFVEKRDENGNFIEFTEEVKEDFLLPPNWEQIKKEAVKAIRSVGLDIGAVDVRVEHTETKNGKRKETPRFVIIETNSAPSFGEITKVLYKKTINEILLNKYKKNSSSQKIIIKNRRSANKIHNGLTLFDLFPLNFFVVTDKKHGNYTIISANPDVYFDDISANGLVVMAKNQGDTTFAYRLRNAVAYLSNNFAEEVENTLDRCVNPPKSLALSLFSGREKQIFQDFVGYIEEMIKNPPQEDIFTEPLINSIDTEGNIPGKINPLLIEKQNMSEGVQDINLYSLSTTSVNWGTKTIESVAKDIVDKQIFDNVCNQIEENSIKKEVERIDSDIKKEAAKTILKQSEKVKVDDVKNDLYNLWMKEYHKQPTIIKNKKS